MSRRPLRFAPSRPSARAPARAVRLHAHTRAVTPRRVRASVTPAQAPAVLALLLVCVLAGCARAPLLEDHLAEAAPRQVELTEVGFQAQDDYQCGPAALATVLTWSGHPVSAEALVPRVYLPAREGSLQPELRASARAFDRLAYEPEPTLDTLLAELQAGHPVLVMQNLGLGPWPVWHYAVLVGFDADAGELILRSGVTERKVLSTRRFAASWRRAGAWSLLVLPPGEMPARADYARYADAAADLERTGSPDAAARAWQAATERWPNRATPWFGLGNTRHALGRPAAAVAAYREALRRHAPHVPAHHTPARVYLEAGCHDAALHHLERARESLHRLPAMREHLAGTRAALRTALESAPAASCRLP